MGIGKKLKEMREAAGLSQKEVSQKLGWGTVQLVSNNERDISLPPISCLSKLAKLYEVDETFLKTLVLNENMRIFESKMKKRLKL